jgi:type I restriction enzyme, S subunit
MIGHLKPYPEYKESGLPWLAAVPKHWDVFPNRSLVRIRKVLVGEHHANYQLLSLTKQGVIIRDISTGKGKFSADMGTSQEVRSGDLVFCLFDVPETPRTVGLSGYDGMITSAYTVFEFIGSASREYFELFYRAMDDRKLLSPLYSGLRNTIPIERFRAAKTPQPQPAEQAAIVRFLEWSNARLERAIRSKRKIIALLNEQKQAIIHRAVTRGLDPSAPLKPTGIPWVGDIPRHWELTRLKHLSPQITVGIVIQPARLYVDKGVPCLRSLNISSGKISTDHLVFISQESNRKNSKSQLNQGDMVVVRTGRTGIAVIVNERFDGANCIDLLVVRKARRLLSEYLLFYLRSYAATSDIAFNSVGAIQAHYNTETLGNLRIPLPSTTEQEVILHTLESRLSPTDITLERVTREIELLSEYRTCLVADVVTGKLDVRDVAGRLPEEALSDVAGDDVDLTDEIEAADQEAVV